MQKYSKTGGILTIIAGTFSIFYLFMGIVYLVLPQFMDSILINKPSTMEDPDLFLIYMTMFGIVLCLFALVAGTLSIIGGIFGLQKKHWAFALTGAISAAALFFPIGIIATVLTSMGRLEFSSPQAADPLTLMSHDISTNPVEVN